MSKAVITHTIVLLLMGCAAQGDVTQGEDQLDLEVETREEPGPPYEVEKNYGAYDCSGAWQTMTYVSSQGDYAIVVPIPCVDSVMIDKGDPPPERVEVTSRPSQR